MCPCITAELLWKKNSLREEIGSLSQLYSCVVDADCCNVLRRSRCFLYISTPLHGPLSLDCTSQDFHYTVPVIQDEIHNVHLKNEDWMLPTITIEINENTKSTAHENIQ